MDNNTFLLELPSEAKKEIGFLSDPYPTSREYVSVPYPGKNEKDPTRRTGERNEGIYLKEAPLLRKYVNPTKEKFDKILKKMKSIYGNDWGAMAKAIEKAKMAKGKSA